MTRELAWNQFRLTLTNLASDAERQIAAFPGFVNAADELVLEFDDWYRLIDSAARDQVSVSEWAALEAIDKWVDTMDGRLDPQLFTDEALRADPRWATLRGLAVEALLAFGWHTNDAIGPIDHLSIRQ